MLGQATTILLVDDDNDNRSMYAQYLATQGFAVLEARDGMEGLARITDSSPDLVVTDVLLGPSSSDSLELVRRIRADDRIAHTPVVILTAWTAPAHRDHARQLGCARFLLKPCTPMTLAEEIQRVLARTQPSPSGCGSVG